MNRLGLRAADVDALAQRRDLLDALQLDFVMTHLACADEPAHPLNAEQLARFERLRAVVPGVRSSIANSAGTLLDAAYRGDLARPGIALYVGIGYADGYPRNLGNCGTAAVEGRRVPVVGRVSMDLIVIDVTGVPSDAARVGAAVELIGPTVGVDEVAAAADTISYEILTGLGRRLVREYVEND
jgi:alanine racemase